MCEGIQMVAWRSLSSQSHFRASDRLRIVRQRTLLASVSVLTLLATGIVAKAQPLHGPILAPATVASNAASAASQQAAAIAKQAQASLTRAAQALQAVQAAQVKARSLAASGLSTVGVSVPAVTDGLSSGGLIVDPRVTSGADRNLWLNASLPSQATSNGQTTVTIQQTAPNAVMTWRQFNVGSNTTLVYNQQGNANWVALNRIDATGSPSVIFGQIKADGTVLVINPNGIIFGAGSQVNVNSLIASTHDIASSAAATPFAVNAGGVATPTYVMPAGQNFLVPPNEDSANQYFAQNGLFTIAGDSVANGASAAFALGNQTLGSPGGGLVAVLSGATIAANAGGSASGGYVALLAPNVINAGMITTPMGSIALAAASTLVLTEPGTGSVSTVGMPAMTAAASNAGSVTVNGKTVPILPVNSPSIGGNGLVRNDGLLMTEAGNITLSAAAVQGIGSSLAIDPGLATDPTLLQGVGGLLSFQNPDGTFGVVVLQTAPKAILNWSSFSLGANAALNFLEQDDNGVHTDWVALNRVNDPNGQGSTIRGGIFAPGSIYIANRNGVDFTGTSTVTVGSLVASDLDIGALNMTRSQRDAYFISNGIASSTGTSFSISTTSAGGDQYTPVRGGGVTVEAGASITATLNSPDAPGWVYLFGANVRNSGTITSSAGEVALVAARTVTVAPAGYSYATLPSGMIFRGNGIAYTQYSANDQYDPSIRPSPDLHARANTGLVTNDGLIVTPRGTTIMNGDRVVMSGVISADTSITRNSTVLLNGATSVDVSGTISILPFENGESLPRRNGSATDNTASTVQAFVPAYVEMGAYDVTMETNALISAPSANVSLAVTAPSNSSFLPNLSTGTVPERILLMPGATIDVTGLQNVVLPASYNFISFQPRGLEFADMPLQRGGPLFGKTLWMDIRASGTRSDGSTWLGTPLANANDYVNGVGQSIDMLMTKGGTVSLTTDAGIKPGLADIVLQAGSQINVAGGFVTFLPGQVPVTRLIGADGRLYSMANADPNLTYVGIAGQFVVKHAQWNVTDIFISPLMRTQFVPGYTEGRDAGGITISTIDPILNGTFQFGATAGVRQVAAGLAPTGTQANGAPAQFTPYELPSGGYLSIVTSAAVVIGATDSSAVLPANFTPTTVLPPSTTALAVPSGFYTSNAPYRLDLSASTLSSYGLSSLMITAGDLVLHAASVLSVAAGGQVSFTTGGPMDIQGGITARGGQIKLLTDPYSLGQTSYTASGASDIFVGGKLDTRGRWVNDFGITDPAALGGFGFINGGNISIVTNSANSTALTNKANDGTGSITLLSTAVLDASSGGYIAPSGKIKLAKSGSPAGVGGNITLGIYQGTNYSIDGSGGHPFSPVGATNIARLAIDPKAVLRSYGFASGGALTLEMPGAIVIGDSPAPANYRFSTSFLNSGGFSSYSIQSVILGRYDSVGNAIPETDQITVANGAMLNLTQQNYSASANLLALPTGTDLAGAVPVVTLRNEQRAPVNLALNSQYILLDANSSIVTDPGATILFTGLTATTGSPVATFGLSSLLLGSITDHGGSFTDNSTQLWFGPTAKIDMSGIFTPYSTFGQTGGAQQSGKLYAGGTVTLQANVVGQAGASINVSGAAATIGYSGQGGARLAPGPVTAGTTAIDSWSDAGTINVTAGMQWDGAFIAKSAGHGNGGTLSVSGAIVLQQGVDDPNSNIRLAVANKGVTPSDPHTLSIQSAYTNPAFTSTIPQIRGVAATLISVDKLGDFDTVYLASGTAPWSSGYRGPAVNISPTSLPLTIIGSPDLNVGNRLYISASYFTAATAGSSVNISAPYVLLTTTNGPGSQPPAPVVGTSTLNIYGQTIDIETAVLSGFSNVYLDSAGDIRLSTLRVINPAAASIAGQLSSAGNITLTAQRVYPMSDTAFTITSTGSAGRVMLLTPTNFAAALAAANAAALAAGQPTPYANVPAANRMYPAAAGSSSTDIPLSAGASLAVVAPTIVQNGNLFAPLGQIALGDASVTTTLTIGAGSVTSVSLGNQMVPFGQTEDGSNWFYSDNTHPLLTTSSATGDILLPSKGVSFNGSNVTVDGAATIDLRGGGDLLAMEFVQGKGGNRDVLTPGITEPNVYALLPSQSAPVAATDIDFNAKLGDANPLAGQQIYLQGGNGIAAGLYTVYSAHYATLPGALRVVDYGSALAKPGQAGHTLPDGTQIIAGYTTQSTNPAARSSGTELFKVQTNPVWRQYSEIDANSANSYFAAKAQHDGTIVPYLPMDAGRLAINAQQSLTLTAGGLAGAQTAAAAGGRGSELDLAANQLAMIGHGQTAQPGYVGIDVTQLGNFESMLVGGLRTDQVDGSVVITPVASQVLVDTKGDTFAAPEIILVATPAIPTITLPQTTFTFSGTTFKFSPSGVDSGTATAGTGNIVINSGSVIHATGTTGYLQPRRYVMASSSAAMLATALGGTLSADGHTITGANIKLLQNNDPTVLRLLRLYGGNPDSGAMLTLTSDPLLSITSLSGSFNSTPLTINFLAGTLPVTGSLTNLPVGNVIDTGSVSIGANADISTSTMTVNATKNVNAISIDGAVKLNASRVNLIARNFAIGGGVPAGVAATLSNAAFNQLANGRVLSLKAFNGGIDLYGDLDLGGQGSSRGLTFDTPWLAGHGGNDNISTGGTLTLTNRSGASTTPTAPVFANKTLAMTADEIDIGGGTLTLAGFGTVDWTADARVFVANSGKLTLGTDTTTPVALNVTTPNILVGAGTSSGAGTGSQFLLTTAGNVKIQRPDPFKLDATGSHPVLAGVSYLFADGTPPGDQVVFSVGGTITSAQGLVTTFGANSPVTLDPGSTVILSASGGTVALQTGNAPIAIAYAAKPGSTTQNGGDFQINAASFDDAGTIQVQAGTLTIHTTGTFTDTSGTYGIRLGNGAYIAAGGYKQSFFDLDRYLSAGKVVLSADAGNITTAAANSTGLATTIDLSQPLDANGNRGLAFAGELDVTAAAGNADLNGNIVATALGGRGGVFHLDTAGLLQHSATDNPLDRLAGALSAGGMTGEINIHTHSGNLVLSAGNTLQANTVTLVADTDKAQVADTNANGNVTIAGTISADGYSGTTPDGTNQAGGQVGLWCANSVTLASTGKILARAGGSDVAFVAGSSYALPSKIVWFNNGTDIDTVSFSASGSYTSDGGATYTTFAAGSALTLPKNTEVVLDQPGSVALTQTVTPAATGPAQVSAYELTHPDERGGDVVIGVSWNAPWDHVNHIGGINLQAGSLIDVSGGTRGGLSDGTVKLRAPNDGYNDVKIQNIGSTIIGARSVSVEAYVAFSTGTSSNDGIPSLVTNPDGTTKPNPLTAITVNGNAVVSWDGIVDPAGWFDSNGALVNGSWSNISGWQLNVTAGSGYTTPPTITVTANGSPVTVVTSLKVVTLTVTSGGAFTGFPTVTFAAPTNPGGTTATAAVTAGLTNIAVVNGPTGVKSGATVTFVGGTGTAATGTAIVNAQGVLTGVTITGAGSYTSAPNSITVPLAAGGTTSVTPSTAGGAGFQPTFTIKSLGITNAGQGYVAPAAIGFGGGQTTAPVVTDRMGVAATVISLNSSISVAPTVSLSGGTGVAGFTAATASVASSTTIAGTEIGGNYVAPSLIGFLATNTNGLGDGRGTAIFTPTAVNTAHSAFYAADSAGNPGILEQIAQGTWNATGSPGTQYGLSAAQTRLGSLAHIQPGIELNNPNTTINNGDITVASNWNLAAGTAYNTATGAALAAGSTYSFANNDVNFIYRYGLEPGSLTLRAVRDVNVNASISDGFFQFRNYNDNVGANSYVSKTYAITTGTSSSVGTYNGGYRISTYGSLNGIAIVRTAGQLLAQGSVVALPVAPYVPLANVASPSVLTTTTGTVVSNTANPLLASDDVFPSGLLICTAACTTTSPTLAPTTTIPGSWSYRLTGGANLSSANPNAVQPLGAFSGTLAGHGDVVIGGHSSYNQTVPVTTAPNGVTVTNLTPVAVFVPTMVRTGTGSITITAGRDVRLTDSSAPGVVYAAGVNTALPAAQGDPGFSPIISQSSQGSATFDTVNGFTVTNVLGFLEPRLMQYAAFTNIYGPPTAAAFPQMGGDVTITAQQDVLGVQNVVNPAQNLNSFAQFYNPWLFATGSSGLGAGAVTPITTNATAILPMQTAWWIEFGSFDQGVMSVGGNVTLNAGGDVRDFSVSLPSTARVSGGLSVVNPATGQLNVPVVHLYGSGNMIVRVGRELDSGSFYEGTGQASIVVRGSVTGDWGGSSFTRTNLNATNSIQNTVVTVPIVNTVLAIDSGQISLTAGGSLTLSGIVNPTQLATALALTTYGPDSAVSLSSAGGNITLGASPLLSVLKAGSTTTTASSTYPPSLEVVAFTGAINLPGTATAIGVTMANSVHGSLNLLAATSLFTNGVSSGASVIDTEFNGNAPIDGFNAATSTPVLAHAGDTGSDHIYAVTGDILGTSAVLINRSVEVQAGRDITDFNLTAQNVQASGVSSVIAGRDIHYSGLYNNGGLQIAGPGFFLVEAGRDLGPFVTLAHDTATASEGIISLGNTVSLGGASGKPNFLLPSGGASIVAMFGVGKGVNYQGVIDSYIDPARSSDFKHYLSNFDAFLVSSGNASWAPNGELILKNTPSLALALFSTLDPTTQQGFENQFGSPATHVTELYSFLSGRHYDPATAYWAVFNALPKTLQDVFVVDLFSAHLNSVGQPDNADYQKYQVGYQMINTLFPSAYGYTQNGLGGGTNGANQLVHTGNLDMLHSTIQTMKGGDISLLGPGGSILVGTLAIEPNTKLKLRNLGILTLAGGAINTFTDQDVLVNTSRVFSEFGGNITMWSSNGNLDAGRGAKTTLSFPPLTVNFDPNDIESIDLGGLVSGAGIGTLQTQSFVSASDVILLAPRGTIDAGDAGIRSSGNLSVLAVRVLNADNIQVAGKTTGIPTVPVPDAGKLSSASNTAGAAQKGAELPQQKPDDRPSIIIVEILGYGGGNGDGGAEPETIKRRDDTGPHSYNTNGPVQILGHGELTEQEKQFLNEDERRRL
jgi:filamentous hemagglutinin family protein